MGYIYIYINIFPKKLQFAAYGQFVLVYYLFGINNVFQPIGWATSAKTIYIDQSQSPRMF